jgi:hypothetical protein
MGYVIITTDCCYYYYYLRIKYVTFPEFSPLTYLKLAYYCFNYSKLYCTYTMKARQC